MALAATFGGVNDRCVRLPIAVLGVLKSLGAPRHLEIHIAGKSLFNDCVGMVLTYFVVVFSVNPW